MALSDVIDQMLLANQPSDPGAAGAPLAILPPVAQTSSTPVVAGDPMVITPQTLPTVAAPKKTDWTPPAVTMTPPAVAAVPMGRTSGMIAAQPTPSMMGDVLSAPQRTPRRQVAILTTPSFG